MLCSPTMSARAILGTPLPLQPVARTLQSRKCALLAWTRHLAIYNQDYITWRSVLRIGQGGAWAQARKEDSPRVPASRCLSCASDWRLPSYVCQSYHSVSWCVLFSVIKWMFVSLSCFAEIKQLNSLFFHRIIALLDFVNIFWSRKPKIRFFVLSTSV